MITRRWLFGAAAGVAAAPILAALPKPAPKLNPFLDFDLSADWITEVTETFIPEASPWINVRRPYAALADTLYAAGK